MSAADAEAWGSVLAAAGTVGSVRLTDDARGKKLLVDWQPPDAHTAIMAASVLNRFECDVMFQTGFGWGNGR